VAARPAPDRVARPTPYGRGREVYVNAPVAGRSLKRLADAGPEGGAEHRAFPVAVLH